MTRAEPPACASTAILVATRRAARNSRFEGARFGPLKKRFYGPPFISSRMESRPHRGGPARHSLRASQLSWLVRTSPHQHMIRSSMVPISIGELPSLMAICLVGAAVMSYWMYTFLHPFCTIWPACTR
jgi:hypothetical protein